MFYKEVINFFLGTAIIFLALTTIINIMLSLSVSQNKSQDYYLSLSLSALRAPLQRRFL